MTNSIAIGLAEIKFSKNPEDVLVSFGLGSCLGIGMYDPSLGYGGMLHAVLPTCTDRENPSKFVDSGIEFLLQEMIKGGALKNRLIIRMSGGANMLNVTSLSNSFDIGNRNILSANGTYKKLGIKTNTEEVGGKIGRTVRLYIASGKMTIRMMGEPEREF